MKKRDGAGRSQDHLKTKNLIQMILELMRPDVLVGEEEKLKDEDRNNRLDFPSSQPGFKEYSAETFLG